MRSFIKLHHYSTDDALDCPTAAEYEDGSYRTVSWNAMTLDYLSFKPPGVSTPGTQGSV